MLLKNVYNAKLKNVEDQICNVTNLATNTTFNAKINKVKGEVPRMLTKLVILCLMLKKMRLKVKCLVLTT